MLYIYGASKLSHAPLWLMLRKEWTEFQWTARWPDSHLLDIPESELHTNTYRQFWVEDEQDVADSDVVMVYCQPDDVLRGALVEAGMALARPRMRVVTCGLNTGLGTWQYHPRVYRTKNLPDAHHTLLALSTMKGDNLTL